MPPNSTIENVPSHIVLVPHVDKLVSPGLKNDFSRCDIIELVFSKVFVCRKSFVVALTEKSLSFPPSPFPPARTTSRCS